MASAHVRRDLALFWVSCFMLFFEILMIRWLSAEIRIFAYFHNFVLLFAFLGIALGVAAANRPVSLISSFFIAAGLVALLRADPYVGIRNVSSYLSAATADFNIWQRVNFESGGVAVAAFAVGAILTVALMGLVTGFFIPFGQIMGRLFDGYEKPLRAYGINLAGSLAGIWLFSGLSLLSSPPAVWMAVGGSGGLALLWLLRRRAREASALGILVGLSVMLLYEARTPEQWTIWSPYQKLTIIPATVTIEGQKVQFGHHIFANSASFMLTVNYSPDFVRRFASAFPPGDTPYDHYNIPYRFSSTTDDVLVVGSGAGNDVAGALRNGAQRVTAVEIDPRIIDIGLELHPEGPYSDRRVTVVADDARSFFKKARQTYDLVVFGLLDSHTLSSSYSNVRLDNYVYTVEAFEEARRLLKPNGVMVVLFEVAASDDFIGARIQEMLAQAFGHQPVGFTVRSGFRGVGGTAFVAGDFDLISERVAQDARLAAIIRSTESTHERWSAASLMPATDDWPYLYLPGRGIPILYFFMFGALLLVSLLGIRSAFGQWRTIEWRFFFLGAGFLLLEVQNIRKLALLFGTTWTVNVVVISAVLATIFLANALTARVSARSSPVLYLTLFASLLINLALPITVFAEAPAGLKELLVGVVMGLPFFFAGMIFSSAFAQAPDRPSALASNLLGAMVGGMLEALSFVLGVKALLVVALALYMLALASGRLRMAQKV